MFRINHIKNQNRICSDHFLEENYRPGKKRFLYKNTLPQPYDQKCFENGFPYE